MQYFRELVKNLDRMLLILIVIFAGISIVMISSTLYDTTFIMSREVIVQCFAFGLGFISIIIILLFDYKTFEMMDKVFYVLSIVLLLLVFVPGIGVVHNGARCWIDIGITEIQPSEIVKILFILSFAKYLSTRHEALQKLKGVLLAGLYAAPILILILIEPDLGNTMVIFIIAAGMIFCAGIRPKILISLVTLGLLSMPILYRFMEGHQKERIDAFLHPENLALQGNYQVWNSKIAIGSGGLFGKGLFEGTQKKLDFLPVKQSDFIFAVIGEELGLVGGLLLISLYAIFLYKIIVIAGRAKDFFGNLICCGIFTMFAFQIFENIAMSIGLMPVTGITLPFISYGGTSVLTNMIALGIVLNIGARSKKINY